MKRLLIYALVFSMMIGGTAWALESGDGQKLTGKHFTLNIIGVQKAKTVEMDSDTGNGSTIFVHLGDKSKIGLVESGSDDAPMVAADEFAVLDKNGTDQDGALLALPDPGLDPYLVDGDMTGKDTMSDYSVYVRPLGKPGGWATITTCAQLVDSTFAGLLPGNFIRTLNKTCEWDSAMASVEQVGMDITLREKGPSTFQNVTAELLTIVFKVEVDTDGNLATVEDTVYVRVPIFDDILEGEYWEYDNNGLKILQVRFYDYQTDVSLNDGNF